MTAKIEDGVFLNVGVSGSGKTFTLTRDVFRHVRWGRRVVVLDRMREWNEIPTDLAETTVRIADPRDVDPATREAGLVILTDVSAEKAPGVAEELAKWAIAGRDAGERRGLAFPEAHRIAPNGAPLTRYLDEVACAWRHFGVAMWCDTQRISKLSRTITEQAKVVRLFAIVGDRDQSVVRELGGPQLSEAVLECARRYGRGEPGWHVSLGYATRIPPFKLVREKA